MCILKLLSLPISLNSADSSILLGGSSSPSPSSPTFAVLLLRKMVEQGERVHEFLLIEYFLARLSLLLGVTRSIFPKATFRNIFNKEAASSEYSDIRPCLTKTSIAVHN